jgi:hypothetical protein
MGNAVDKQKKDPWANKQSRLAEMKGVGYSILVISLVPTWTLLALIITGLSPVGLISLSLFDSYLRNAAIMTIIGMLVIPYRVNLHVRKNKNGERKIYCFFWTQIIFFIYTLVLYLIWFYCSIYFGLTIG